jgi:hypothetical protein
MADKAAAVSAAFNQYDLLGAAAGAHRYVQGVVAAALM